MAVENTQLILAALAFLILYVLIHVRKDRFILHMLGNMRSSPRAKQIAKRKTAKTRKIKGRRRR